MSGPSMPTERVRNHLTGILGRIDLASEAIVHGEPVQAREELRLARALLAECVSACLEAERAHRVARAAP